MKWQERNHFSSMVGVAVGLGGAVHFLRLLSLCLTWISRGFVSWLEAPLCAWLTPDGPTHICTVKEDPA